MTLMGGRFSCRLSQAPPPPPACPSPCTPHFWFWSLKPPVCVPSHGSPGSGDRSAQFLYPATPDSSTVTWVLGPQTLQAPWAGLE